MLTNACNVSVNPSNTGFECNDTPLATAMLFMMAKSVTWTDAELLDFTTYLKTAIHATPAARIFPLFGALSPIRNIANAAEADVKETLEDGSVKFIRYGMYNRTLITTEGGLSAARHLMAMRKDYSFIEVDISGQVIMMKLADNSWSGFPVNLAYGAAPDLADLKTSYKNKFELSYSPLNYVRRGRVLTPDLSEDILSLRGLFDVRLDAGTQTQTTTNIFVKVKTIDGETDLIALYTTTLVATGNFVVTKKSDGTPVTITGAAIQAGEAKLTGTFVAATDYLVTLAPPATLKAAGILGYEAVIKATVTIP